uniref:Seipin n=1 Tax=Ascaris lumbricoides TaxID=6252 RepID=A0A0M3HEY0_ASCLU
FRLDDIRAIDVALAVKKNLLKVEIDVPFADEELCDYFERQPIFFSLSVKKHILLNEAPKHTSSSPEQLALRVIHFFFIPLLLRSFAAFPNSVYYFAFPKPLWLILYADLMETCLCGYILMFLCVVVLILEP